MPTPTPGPAGEIPVFATIDDTADWHDTHDTADAPSEEVPSPFATSPGLSQVFSVRFDADTVTRLAAAAGRHHLGVTQLVRAWVIERLGADEAGDTATWTAGLTADALNEIRAVVERTITTATHNHP